MGYTVNCLDFRSPQKSSRYNLLQPIIDAFEAGNKEKAEMYAWDLTNILVGEGSHNEKIWENGEKAVIAASILSVVHNNCARYDPNFVAHKEYQNMTNVYWFLAEMGKEFAYGEKDNQKTTSGMEHFATHLPDDHPAKPLFSISDIAPGRTKGSFYTSALTTLRLFTSLSMYALTNSTDVNISDVGLTEKDGKPCKHALFIILPDERTTYYPVATLIISQLYELLTRLAESNGGRLKRRVNFVLDEFGNFSKLDSLANKLTVARSRGMRFHFFLQSMKQLEEKYNENIAKIIKANCANWIYLKSEDPDTLKEFSEKLGTYTTSANQISASYSKYQSMSTSHSASLISRNLLMPEEVGKIDAPYLLVKKGTYPVLFESPDLSQWHLNRILSLGDKKHNIVFRKWIEDNREEYIYPSKIPLWGIWRDIQAIYLKPQSNNKSRQPPEQTDPIRNQNGRQLRRGL